MSSGTGLLPSVNGSGPATGYTVTETVPMARSGTVTTRPPLPVHGRWIELLLVKYYDPMYEYQIGQRQGVVAASGSREEIIARARELSQS